MRCLTVMSHRRAMAIAVAAMTFLVAAPAMAHEAGEHVENYWTAWDFDFWIVIPLILAAWVYLRGLKAAPESAPSSGTGKAGFWNHLAFFSGLVVFYLVLQSPIEPISDRVFIVHQIEHMGLRTIGPMLVMLAAPQAILIRGLPRWARSGLLAPVVGSAVTRGLFAPIVHPVGATVLFVGVSSFWMIPRFHDSAILDTPIHYTWHATLMLTGLVFFWRVLDQRTNGLSFLPRLVMLWFAVMGNILLGAYLAFKSDVLYTAYGTLGRLWDIGALTDERIGGMTMWVPGAMMLAMAMLAVTHRWRRSEERSEGRRKTARKKVSSEAYLAPRRAGNRAIAFGVAGFILFVFVMSIVVGIVFDHAPT